ncbi:equilibrative nucleoside transporter 3-like [Tubulanus polymorphus]|uniref:equilibrative nucleoside transporter 3-like n=1 Tax=Tubulanus polymorphus TaxID=672921 RepID=UPI003DA4CF89
MGNMDPVDVTEKTPLLLTKNVKEFSQDVKDRYNGVFLIFVVQGLAVIFPFAVFLTAESYFTDYKLIGAGDADYRRNFVSYIGMASQFPNAMINLINLISHGKSRNDQSGRIIASILTLITMFSVTVLLVIVDSHDWPAEFFGATVVSVILINVASGIWSNSIFGLVSLFPMKYVNAAMTGQNACMVVTSVLMLLSKFGESERMSAISYFMSAIVVLVISLDLFLLLPHLRFFRAVKANSATSCLSKSEKLPYLKTFKKIWPQLFDVWLHGFIVLCIYPAMLVDIEKSDPNFFIPAYLYTDVMAYLVSTICAFIGNLLNYVFVKPKPQYVIVILLARFLMIPFFAMCNYRPQYRSMSVLFKNDWVYLAGLIFHGITNGHVSGLTMMYAKSAAGDDPAMQKTAGMMAALTQSISLLMGPQLSLFVAYLVENV